MLLKRMFSVNRIWQGALTVNLTSPIIDTVQDFCNTEIEAILLCCNERATQDWVIEVFIS